MSLWDKAWPGGSIRLGLANGAAPLDADRRIPFDFMPSEIVEGAILHTTDFEIVRHFRNDVNTADGSVTGTLPPDLREGERFPFNDYAGTWATNPFYIDPNGHEFEDLGDGSDPSEPMSCAGVARFEIVFAAGKLRVRL